MIPNELSAIACSLILAGMAAENFLAQRWLISGARARFDTLAFLAVILPATGVLVLCSMLF